MTDPDEPSVLGDVQLTATVPDDVWARALSAAFDPDAHAADATVVPVMDDAGDLPDTTSDDGSYVHHVTHDARATDHDLSAHDTPDHDAIDLGEHDEHGPAHDQTHSDTDHGNTGHGDTGHGDTRDGGHDHDSGWHV